MLTSDVVASRTVTDERYVWDILLSPWFLLLLAIISCGLVCLHLCREAQRTPLDAKSLFVEFLFCCAALFLFKPCVFELYHQIPLEILFVFGTLCMTFALTGRLGIIIWSIIFLLASVATAAHYMGVSLTFPNLVQLFGASWQDAREYITPLNLVLLPGSLIISFSAAYLAYRIFRRDSRFLLLMRGFVAITAAIGMFQVSQEHIQTGNSGLWPLGNSLSISYHSCRALKILHHTRLMCQNLPQKNTTGASAPQITKDDGIIVILHIGESMRADHLSINGYDRETTPRLAALPGLISFSNCTSAAPTTDRAVMAMLTNGRRDYTAEKRKEYLTSSPPLPDFFAESRKFATASFWPTDYIYGKTTPLFTEEVRFFTRSMTDNTELPGLPLDQIEPIKQYLNQNGNRNLFLILNNRGSHAPFNEFNTEKTVFPVSQPITFDLLPKIHPQDASDILNAYDNTACELDEYIGEITDHLKGKPFLYIYMSDHGEFVGQEGYWYRTFAPDDAYHKTAACRIPFLIYASPEFLERSPHFKTRLNNLRSNKDMPVGQEHLFHTILGTLGIKTPYYEERMDLSTESPDAYTGPHPDRDGKEAQE